MDREVKLPAGVDDAAVAHHIAQIWAEYSTNELYSDELSKIGINQSSLTQLPSAEPSGHGDIAVPNSPIRVRRTNSDVTGVEAVVIGFVAYVGMKLVDKITDRSLDKLLDDFIIPELKRRFKK